jgi:general secretion pathway protein K
MTTRPPSTDRAPRHQRGAALLIAMLILTLVTTLAAGMVWQQWRAVQVESAERARSQSAWILIGALDWARLILREDARASTGNNSADHLGEPWAVPLAEARLSTFLAADRDNNASDTDGPEAFLSGLITDAQSRYNLRNLIDGEGKVDPQQLQILQRLCASAGLPSDSAGRIANGLRDAAGGGPGATIAPEQVGQLTWLGLDEAAVEKLRPWIVLLPETKPINLNTAPREVLAAVVEGLDLGGAERLVEVRQRSPFKSLTEALAFLPAEPPPDESRVNVSSSYFEVLGRLRLADHVLEERSLVQRQPDRSVRVLQRERLARTSSPLP